MTFFSHFMNAPTFSKSLRTLWFRKCTFFSKYFTFVSEKHGLAAVIGVRTEGLIAASVIPLALTMVLFLGPIVMLVSNERFRWLMHPSYWSQSLTDLVWWRNHVVAPFTEELAFRYA